MRDESRAVEAICNMKTIFCFYQLPSTNPEQTDE